MAGNAARKGCQELLTRIKPVAARLLECQEDLLIFKNNHIFAGSDKHVNNISFSKLAGTCFQKGISLYANGWHVGPHTSWDEESGQGEAYFTFVYAANLAEVEVDTVTGNIRVLRFVSSHDVGRVININGAKGQVFGGVAMGLGYAIMEDYIEEDSRPTLENFDEYLIPTICDMPDMKVNFIENPDELGPFGAKSLGEPACEIAAPAIANAVANATGRRIRDIPLTLERVLLGCALSRKDKRGSVKSRSNIL
jgi:CO/xanthine dehydrogenase Mo-binding subunit